MLQKKDWLSTKSVDKTVDEIYICDYFSRNIAFLLNRTNISQDNKLLNYNNKNTFLIKFARMIKTFVAILLIALLRVHKHKMKR